MARSGILKSEIQKARDSLLAQGRHPSIDAVRVALGNTGSKTTIQRYLRELEQEQGSEPAKDAAPSDAIQDLVNRLAARLQEEADAKVIELAQQCDAKLREQGEVLAQQRGELTALGDQLRQTVAALENERSMHDSNRQALAEINIANQGLTQQVAALVERLKDNEAHRLSLEEKHQHAREALTHYRQSVKDQREQEQRRHEQQVQQLQIEVRTLNQTVIVKQNELTQLHQDVAKSTAEVAAIRKDLRRGELENQKLALVQEDLRRRVSSLEATEVLLTERLQRATTERDDARGLLQAGEAQARQAAVDHAAEAAELTTLRARVSIQAELLASIKAVSAPVATAPGAESEVR